MTTTIPDKHPGHLARAGRSSRCASRTASSAPGSILGSGKYTDNATMVRSFEAAGTEIVTVAVRRVNLASPEADSFVRFIDPEKYLFLPNTAGCYTADEAVRTARLARELGGWNWVKLEVIGDRLTLFPDNVELLAATKILVAEGFMVLPYTNDDPVVCKKLEDLGAAAVMPLGAPIGSGMGIRNPSNLQDHRRAVQSAGDRRRRAWAPPATPRWRWSSAPPGADEHRHRRRRGSGAHGPRHEAGGRGRLAGRPRRAHPQTAARLGLDHRSRHD